MVCLRVSKILPMPRFYRTCGRSGGQSATHDAVRGALGQVAVVRRLALRVGPALGLRADGAFTVRDEGRGIRIDPDASGKPFVEHVLTTYYWGPTCDGHYPHNHIEPIRMALFVINALCDWLEIEIDGAHGRYVQRYECGVAVAPLERTGPGERHGTGVTALPDRTIFSSIDFDPGRIHTMLDRLAALRPGLRFELRDERRGSVALLERPEGLLAILDAASA
jgi:DNA gyrase subunit B